MTAYPRMIEILQLLGSSSLMILPSEADFKGPLAPAYRAIPGHRGQRARDRVKLFRLAWDVAGNSFGSARCCTSASSPATR